MSRAGEVAAGVVADLVGGAKVAAAPAALGMPLCHQETKRMVVLGSDTAAALEGAMRAWRPSERECDLAARIAAALEERLIFASVLLVGGAARRRAFRHPVPTAAVCGRDALAVVVEAALIAAGTAFAWNPTVRGGKSEDTFIAAGDGAVLVTNTADWPVVLGRPAILPTSLPG
jgi:hypothetical protein